MTLKPVEHLETWWKYLALTTREMHAVGSVRHSCGITSVFIDICIRFVWCTLGEKTHRQLFFVRLLSITNINVDKKHLISAKRTALPDHKLRHPASHSIHKSQSSRENTSLAFGLWNFFFHSSFSNYMHFGMRACLRWKTVPTGRGP